MAKLKVEWFLDGVASGPRGAQRYGVWLNAPDGYGDEEQITIVDEAKTPKAALLEAAKLLRVAADAAEKQAETAKHTHKPRKAAR